MADISVIAKNAAEAAARMCGAVIGKGDDIVLTPCGSINGKKYFDGRETGKLKFRLTVYGNNRRTAYSRLCSCAEQLLSLELTDISSAEVSAAEFSECGQGNCRYSCDVFLGYITSRET